MILEVSNRFAVHAVTRKGAIPHVTLFGPFSTEKEDEMIKRFISVCKSHQSKEIKFCIIGFGRIKRDVIYADISPSIELENLRRELAKELLSVSKACSWDSKDEFIFHSTIAFKLGESHFSGLLRLFENLPFISLKKFDQIWAYIKAKDKPSVEQTLLRVTIIKNQRILCEYDLIQGQLLYRKEAFDKRVFRRTIELLKKKKSVD